MEGLEERIKKLEEFYSWVIDQHNKIAVKVETNDYGLQQVYHALELAGLMKAGEPTAPKKQSTPTPNPIDAINFDIAKIVWDKQDMPGKGPTWFADELKNKGIPDYEKMVKTMKLAKEAKGEAWFWTKMPEGRGFMWLNRDLNGVYRRLKT